ncbi:oxygenase MpaB family protein [Pendulispora albinea]|uniref:DUF2236 domain-containing protein n=1 Tax=Pendulispora albinea TaxID=2741071 RepID=A0ABZ2LT17_9BACT
MGDVAFATPEAIPARWRDPMHPPAWAKRLVGYCRTKLQPGHPFMDVLQKALLEGDPLADDLVACMDELPAGEGRRMFELALEHGIDAVPGSPKALARFFAHLDRVPAWVEPETLRYACETIQRVGIANGYALACGSLMSGYLSSAAVKPLMTTGALTSNTSRRIAETGKFVLDITESGDMGRYTAGFKTTVRVRLLHAFVRAKLGRSPEWKTHEWGLPVNQSDLLGTNLQFSTTYLLSLRVLGILHSRREREAIMHFWRYVGYVMGVDEKLLPRNYREGKRYLRLLGASQPDPDEDSRALASALVYFPLAYGTTPFERRATAILCALRGGLSRSIMGDVAADALGLPDDRWKYAVFAISPAISTMEIARRLVPGGRRVAVRVGRRILRSQITRGLALTQASRIHV